MKKAILVVAMCLAFAPQVFARGGGHGGGHSSSIPASGSLASYGGGKHTESHGGRYVGGSGGSAHRGGTYVNQSGQQQYGQHK